MAKLDERVAEVGGFTIFRKSDSEDYEIVGPSESNSPLSYTMIRLTSAELKAINEVVRVDKRRRDRV